MPSSHADALPTGTRTAIRGCCVDSVMEPRVSPSVSSAVLSRRHPPSLQRVPVAPVPRPPGAVPPAHERCYDPRLHRTPLRLGESLLCFLPACWVGPWAPASVLRVRQSDPGGKLQASRRASRSLPQAGPKGFPDLHFRNLPPRLIRQMPSSGSPRLPGNPSQFASRVRGRLRAVPAIPRTQPVAPHPVTVNPSGAAPGFATARASSLELSGLNSGALSSPVYASRPALPLAMQDSVPAGGLRLCRAGVEPAGLR